MVFAGANIYNEGVGINNEMEEKIRQIINEVNSNSTSSELSMKFLKSGQIYEGLVWGKADNTPIGAYNRGISMNHVLESLYKRVKKECLKACKFSGGKKKKVVSNGPANNCFAWAG